MNAYRGTAMGEATGSSYWTPKAPKDGELVFSNDDFDLWQVKRSSGWFSLKLIDKRDGERKKRSFRIGWNGVRFAEGKELQALQRYNLKHLTLEILKAAGF